MQGPLLVWYASNSEQGFAVTGPLCDWCLGVPTSSWSSLSPSPLLWRIDKYAHSVVYIILLPLIKSHFDYYSNQLIHIIIWQNANYIKLEHYPSTGVSTCLSYFCPLPQYVYFSVLPVPAVSLALVLYHSPHSAWVRAKGSPLRSPCFPWPWGVVPTQNGWVVKVAR